MKKNTLLRTNMLICVIITIGFILTSYISYQSNYGIFEKDIENVSALASDGIYNQIDSIFAQPVSVSLTMANDSLLKSFLSNEEKRLNDEMYIQELRSYLDAYREKYSYDSIFLVSAKTNRYYHFNGLDRVLTKESPENVWYYNFLDNQDEYSLNVDNDEAKDNSITIFVNCRIKSQDGTTMGVVGVGLKVENLQQLLKHYNDEFEVRASLVDDNGVIQISSDETGHENVNLFDAADYSEYKDEVLQNRTERQEFWYSTNSSNGYLVSRYIPNLKWHLIIQNDTSVISQKFHNQFIIAVAVIVLIVLLVLIIITSVIRKYNKQISELTVASELEYQRLLHKTTEGLYENIFEFDITHNCAGGEGTKRYFESLGINGDTPYDQAIAVIAQKQIKEEYIKGYLELFAVPNVLEVYASGISSLTYDSLFSNDGKDYHWMRITAQIFFWSSDQSVRMITYRRNIDEEKRREISLVESSQKDSLSSLYNKHTTEEMITAALEEEASAKHVFLIFDIDNFKNINDNMGHAFGDSVIAEFSVELKDQFRDTDIVGRVGGDEFVVMMKNYNSVDDLKKKLDRFCSRLSRKNFGTLQPFTTTCSIGGALFPRQGATYAELYEKADQALYYSKSHGKGYFSIYGGDASNNTAFHLNPRDITALINAATDGVSKIACVDGGYKMLYFNQKRAELTGTPIKVMSKPDFDVLSQIHPDDVNRVIGAVYEALLHKSSFFISLRLCHEDGRHIPVKLKGLFVSELYENKYPVFYAIYSDMSGAG